MNKYFNWLYKQDYIDEEIYILYIKSFLLEKEMIKHNIPYNEKTTTVHRMSKIGIMLSYLLDNGIVISLDQDMKNINDLYTYLNKCIIALEKED
jgi:hypothetical protein